MINPKEFEASFQFWINETARLVKEKTVSIDGETICASRDYENREIHMVSAWANKQRLVLGQIKTDENSTKSRWFHSFYCFYYLKHIYNDVFWFICVLMFFSINIITICNLCGSIPQFV